MRFWPVLMICGAVAACSPAKQADGNGAAIAAAAGKVQHLRKIPLVVKHADGAAPTRMEVEVALTPDEQERGFQYRTDVKSGEGMIFPMVPPRRPSFWMKDTPMALDIIFIRTDGSIERIVANAPPGDKTPIFVEIPVSGVLELRGGDAAALGIEAGDRVSWGACTFGSVAAPASNSAEIATDADNFCPA